MDEPFGALDSLTRSIMQDFLLEIWEEQRKTVVLVTHDIDEAIYLADKTVVMTAHPGRIREVIDVNLPRPRRYEMRSEAPFIELRDHVTEIVRTEAIKRHHLGGRSLNGKCSAALRNDHSLPFRKAPTGQA